MLPESLRNQANLAVRDEYVFDFLELGDRHSERELEQALLGKVDTFLRQMGGMSTFMGSQYRLEVSDQEFLRVLRFFDGSCVARSYLSRRVR